MHKTIASLQNPLLKKIALLQEKSRERKKSGLFVVEGKRELLLALKGGYKIQTLLYCSEITDETEITPLLSASQEVINITRDIYQKLAYRASTEGVLALIQSKPLSLSQLVLESKNPLILVAEAPEKPGNIGALLRTADAANVDAVIIANPRTDLYNPNVIRSSVGCLFTNQLATGSTSEIISYLESKSISIYSAILQDAVSYHTCNFTQPSAIVVGTEADGLSQEWRDASTQNIIIPMQGAIDSMNVSVAAGILIFEAKRQRNFNQ